MKTAKFFILLFLLIFGTYFFGKPYLYELRVNIEKYTQRNIPQNTGIHKLALILFKKASILLPNYDHFALNRQPLELGVGTYKSASDSILQAYQQIYVGNNTEIITALKNSTPGTVINILPGKYSFEGSYLVFNASGNEFAPIILRANSIGEVIFDMNLHEGILLSSSYVKIENIIFQGRKTPHDSIEHAIHIVGNADYVEISHNEFINFNAHIKSNGIPDKNGQRIFPDNVKISYNNFYNQWKRNTISPASPIDVVGGKNWVINNNFIADFAKYGQQGRGVTYGLFLKGASENGLIENNLVNCSWQVPHTSPNDVRIGISLGNGGTGKRFCMDNSQCNFEHYNGTIRNNTVLNCKNDISIYINKGKKTTIYNNLIINSLGIEVRWPASSAHIYGNILDGRIKVTHGASAILTENSKSVDYFQ